MITLRNTLASGRTISGSTPVTFSELHTETAVDTTYDLVVESVSGAPSGASLTAKFQRWMPILGGAVDEAGGSWFDMIGPANHNSITGSLDLSASVKYLSSYQFGETGGLAVAQLTLRDGSAGTVVRQVSLQAGGSFGENFPADEMLEFPNGLFVQTTSGAWRGSVTGSVGSTRAYLPAGDWPALLADQNLAAARSIMRTIKGGFRHRVVLTPAFTGGTSPAFVVSCVAQTRF